MNAPPPSKRGLSLGLILALSLAIGACDPSPEDPDPAEAPNIAFAEPVADYAIWVSERGTVALKCPGALDDLSCDAHGIRWSGDAPSTIAIKARGHSFELMRVADGPETVALSPLPSRESSGRWSPELKTLDAFSASAFHINTALGPAEAVKFYIADLRSDPIVYLIDTDHYREHFNFVRVALGDTRTPEEFYYQNYRGEDRLGMVGTLVRYPALDTPAYQAPITLNFFARDDLTVVQAALAHRLLEERLPAAAFTGTRDRLLYIPAGDDPHADAADNPAHFRLRGIPWAPHTEIWADRPLQILNEGLAFGTLRRLGPEDLETQVLSFTDIVVLTDLPNALPLVGGTITERPQTPLAHVNLAALARGTPNIAYINAAADARITDHLGQLVRFEVRDGDFTIEPTTIADAEAFWASRIVDPITPEFDLSQTQIRAFDALVFTDARSVGAKAANLAVLHGIVPEYAPNGLGIPFHFYATYMAQQLVAPHLAGAAVSDCLEEGRAPKLCAAAHALYNDRPDDPPGGFETLDAFRTRVLSTPEVAADTLLREAVLDGIRFMIGHTPLSKAMAATLDDAAEALFADIRIRLRSSTNAEDLDSFSGAGLYRSVSAYARGEDRASVRIRKVWASLWSWRAHEERTYWGIDHDAVFMGVAVTRAYPDEAANGVLITQNIGDPLVRGMVANIQLGEVPVTNPEGGATPEIISIIPAPGGGIQLAQKAWSSLSPGQSIMTPAEMKTLFDVANSVQGVFAPFYGMSAWGLTLDLEFKLIGPERALIIKQARPFVLANL